MNVREEGERRNNSKGTRAHLEAMVLRTKPEANQWLHLIPRKAALGAEAFEVVNIDDHFRDRMGEVNRGHIEVLPKLWNLRPYDKTNGEITRIPRLTAAYHKVREETKGWDDYKKLPEEIPEFPLIRRIMLEAVSVVQTPRLRAFETNERRVAKFSEILGRDLLTRIKQREGGPATQQLRSLGDLTKNGRNWI